MKFLIFWLFPVFAVAQENNYLAQFSCLSHIEKVTGQSSNLSRDLSVRAYADASGIYIFSRTGVQLYPYGLDFYSRESVVRQPNGRFEKRVLMAFVPPIAERSTVVRATANVWYRRVSEFSDVIEKVQFSTEFLGEEEYKKSRGILLLLSDEVAVKEPFKIPPLLDQDIATKLKALPKERPAPIQRACQEYLHDLG